MSIIVTLINGNGIMHAADSNLTDSNGNHAGTAKKVFKVPNMDAGLTVAGCYAVGNMAMDQWMNSFLTSNTSLTLDELVEALRASVDAEANADQKASGYFFHIAGYQGAHEGRHPEFYHVTNFDLNSEGDYVVNSPVLRKSEDFWSTYSGKPLNEIFSNGFGQFYCNGFPSGRQIYFALLDQLAKLRASVWSNQKWEFRPPISADEECEVLKLDMEHINLFFRHSSYSAPFIGGPIETLAIPFK